MGKPRNIKFGKSPYSYSNLDVFLESPQPPNGSIEIKYGDDSLPLHFYFEDRGYNTTVITFHGATSEKIEVLPAWQGMGITENVPANRILFSDPSLALDIDLKLSWFAGNLHQPTLQEDISKIIQHLTLNKRVVLFGTSGGGFAALEQSTRLENEVIVVVSNPQTDIFAYYKGFTDAYLNLAWPDTPPSEIQFQASVIDAYRNRVKAKVFYIQNAGDSYHVAKHLIPFLANNHPDNTVELITPYIGPGHIGPSKDYFESLFKKICAPDSFDALSLLVKSVDFK